LPLLDARRRRALLFLAVLALAAGLALPRWLGGTPVATVPVERGDLLQTVVATGRIETPQRVDLGARITARVVRIPVAEGQRVARGALLVELDDREERAALAQAHAQVAQAQARLRQIRELGLPAAQQGLRQAEANLTQAQRNFERQRELHGRGFIGRSQLDDAERSLEVSESQVRAARLQVAANAPQGSEAALAQAALQQAQANEEAAQTRLAHTRVLAPVDGTLIARSVEPGDTVQPGRTLMVLAPAGETQIVTQIDEKNLARLRPGQQALAAADAYPGERFGAVLVYINPAVDPQRGAVEVKLDVPDPPASLRQDMTVSVDIAVAEKRDTLIAPADAVRDARGSPWVLVAQDGRRAERRQVKLGAVGDGRIEILEGVAAGERLIPAAEAAVKPGQRVRPAAP
jgi:HlyD family secretion protein